MKKYDYRIEITDHTLIKTKNEVKVKFKTVERISKSEGGIYGVSPTQNEKKCGVIRIPLQLNKTKNYKKLQADFVSGKIFNKNTLLKTSGYKKSYSQTYNYQYRRYYPAITYYFTIYSCLKINGKEYKTNKKIEWKI